MIRIGFAAAFAALVAVVARAQDVPIVSIGVPDALGTVEFQNEAVTVRRYKKWEDAYSDGVLNMVPPGKKLDLGTDLGIKAPKSTPITPPLPPKEEARVPLRTNVTLVKTYDSWQAAYLDGYGFPAAGQKLPKKPEPKANDTAAEAPKAAEGNATATAAAGNDTAAAAVSGEIPKVAKTGARRMLAAEVPREKN